MERSCHKNSIFFWAIFCLGMVLASLFFTSLFFQKKLVFENGSRVKVRMVRSSEEKYVGLSGIRSICADCGMLFVFKKPGYLRFSMRDMRFNLDFIWLREGRVIEISKNIPVDFPGELIPKEKADGVLEINAGVAEKMGIEVGQRFELE